MGDDRSNTFFPESSESEIAVALRSLARNTPAESRNRQIASREGGVNRGARGPQSRLNAAPAVLFSRPAVRGDRTAAGQHAAVQDAAAFAAAAADEEESEE